MNIGPISSEAKKTLPEDNKNSSFGEKISTVFKFFTSPVLSIYSKVTHWKMERKQKQEEKILRLTENFRTAIREHKDSKEIQTAQLAVANEKYKSNNLL